MNELLDLSRKDLINFLKDKFDEKEGLLNTKIPSLHLYSTTTLSEFVSVIFEPSICIALQGSKAVGFGDDMYGYNESKFLLASTHVPANVRIEEASEEKPYLALKITFSLEQIYEVLKELNDTQAKSKKKPDKGLFFDDMSMDLLNPISRLIKLLDTPQKNIDFLSPFIIKEILYVLLNGNSGDFLKQYVMEGSISSQIVKVITEIRNNFAENLNIKELSKKMSISESSLYTNFKKITTLTPIQFQKKLRLEEAKQMLLNQNIDASQVAFLVGYESPSQFSREYSRMYGLPPKAHISLLKANIA
ncbi:transcriptional regulator, AraC family [Arcobacter venerupis]|uniref:Transcriptional regulator, AraC family n=1 Tax=Arcobacter venerupis TaxID=1054033 RepID=A0AAE7BA24_9BACT|nr:AraC family transcriptional regulator [Arcobacter venerupis]QKF66514.1 transcriptional regulator, AraC family [Arcobacter venerupis]RWS48252.1 AraC family transcriptional regulator [Arcobacter venerupis]